MPGKQAKAVPDPKQPSREAVQWALLGPLAYLYEADWHDQAEVEAFMGEFVLSTRHVVFAISSRVRPASGSVQLSGQAN